MEKKRSATKSDNASKLVIYQVRVIDITIIQHMGILMLNKTITKWGTHT